jgi:hypothetical protein
VDAWSTTYIYSRYVYKWLLREERRTGSVLSADEKLIAAEQLAWELFNRALVINGAYGSIEVTDLVIDGEMLDAAVQRLIQGRVYVGDPRWLATDIQERNFLIRRTGIRVAPGRKAAAYAFAHKSFFEYLLASHVVTQLCNATADLIPLSEVLRAPFPDEVIGFIRELLREVHRENVRITIETNLAGVLEGLPVVRDYGPTALALPRTRLDDDARLEMARQQAGNLIPIVASPDMVAKLVARAGRERSDFVRRGIAVGLALHHAVVGPLDEFVALMDDPARGEHAISVHVGYNRVYYGDQGRTVDWLDDETLNCAGFFRNTVAQLANPGKYGAIWSMTFFTLRWLLESGRHLGDADIVKAQIQFCLERCRHADATPSMCTSQLHRFVQTCIANGFPDTAVVPTAVAPDPH